MPRLFLLPISTRRTLIYCERVHEKAVANGAQPPLTERMVTRASQTWMTWEKAEKGWQKQLTVYGNALFRRIPYEEWGLKSFPPATEKRLKEVDSGNLKFECLFPGKFVRETKVSEILQRLATERQALHRRRMWTCIALMPVSAPFTLVPVIPNIPFFYLVFRAYSHYRAIYGGKLLEHLVTKKLVSNSASPKLDQIYAAGLLHPTQPAAKEASPPSESEIEKVAVEAEKTDTQSETMLLKMWNGKLLAEGFDLPEMEIEIERAVEQVEKALEKEKAEGATKADEKKKEAQQ